MVKLYDQGVYLRRGRDPESDLAKLRQQWGEVPAPEQARKGTIAHGILEAHNGGGEGDLLRLKFDALASHDITFVNAIQTAKASGLKQFPVPYVLTNCHNSLCAVGGTINEDDHRFGLSAAKRYGGVCVPAHVAVIHQVMRELYAGCGKMILGTDSHTRYGALGTMGVGEGGGEMVKQLLSKPYDIRRPQVVCIYLTGRPAPGVGPQDVALALIGATFQNGFVKNKVMEFVGDGVANLSMDFRSGVDTMTTETSCLTSIWETDDKTRAWLSIHGREEEYRQLSPAEWAYYDSIVYVDLAQIKPMIALPFHPSNTYTIEELNANPGDILRKVELDAVDIVGREIRLTDKVRNGKLHVDQGVIAGCAGGTYENIVAASHIIDGTPLGSDEFALSVYPASQPVFLELLARGAVTELARAGATIRTAFCGPCFGAGDVPFNDALSIRHTTRNFPHREGSRPGDGQMASVALMDARSIAATARSGGVLTPATDVMDDYVCPEYHFDDSVYKSRIYNGFGHPQDTPLAYGPNIVDWPEIPAMPKHLLMKVVTCIHDPVTTTDELIPSGETSSYRSNPLRLAEFTLSRKDPQYVAKAKEVQELARRHAQGGSGLEAAVLLNSLKDLPGYQPGDEVGMGSAIYAVKPGDGSAREQAASCQRVLGGCANIAREYATKRYRSNLINWGMLPFLLEGEPPFGEGAWLFVPNIREIIASGRSEAEAWLVGEDAPAIRLSLGSLTDDERRILLAGCLINDYREN